LGIGAVLLIGFFIYFGTRFQRALPKEMRDRADTLVSSIKLDEVQAVKAWKKEKHITFIFTSRRYAERFAEMNGGTLQG